MKLPLSWAAAYETPLFVLLAMITILVIGASEALAYEDYSGCESCHGGFLDDYTSPSDGAEWGISLHDVHRNDMLNRDCDVCHTSGGRSTVFLGSSNGGDGLSAISCVGCHGRDEDMGQTTTTGTAQRGAGLRQHHVGSANCTGCHDDQTGYTPVGENVLPNYYSNPATTEHPLIPTDSCNRNGEEGAFGGNLLGLDNDGDDIYDASDPDCTPCVLDTECDDAAFCNGAESCNVSTGQCEPGTPPVVDDGVGCTDDSCDEANDVVVNAPNDGLCDNGAFCNGQETCDAINDCQIGTPPCDPGAETCNETRDICELIGCQSDAECDDAAFCNGAETCNLGTGQCVSGTPVDVDDGVSCTDDSCDETNDVIVNVPNDGLCDNGAFCDGSETCDAVSDCQAGTPPCDPGAETCNETRDICELIGCQSDAECDDAAFCNGAETCNLGTGQCVSGTPVDVDDGVSCTDDSCDETNDVIVNVPNDGLCDNGAFCDGSETCDAVSDCQAGTPPCDPGAETCNETRDICELIGCQSDAECDDAAFCNGAETCNLGTGQCVSGTPVDVDDGVSCTDDSCDETNDVIVNVPNDGLCDNGAFCDGSETCDAVSDCQAGTPPCDPGAETCNETADMCEPIDMLDLDVASLRVTKRVSLTRLKSVGLTLVVKNTGTVEGTALATITGMQNGIEVYNETLTVTDTVGNGRTKYDDDSMPSIPPFVPTVEGDILWRATIADDDPDIDVVTATTTVVP